MSEYKAHSSNASLWLELNYLFTTTSKKHFCCLMWTALLPFVRLLANITHMQHHNHIPLKLDALVAWFGHYTERPAKSIGILNARFKCKLLAAAVDYCRRRLRRIAAEEWNDVGNCRQQTASIRMSRIYTSWPIKTLELLLFLCQICISVSQNCSSGSSDCVHREDITSCWKLNQYTLKIKI